MPFRLQILGINCRDTQNTTFMTSRASSSASLCRKTPPPRPPSPPDIPDFMQGSDIQSPLMEKKSPTWSPRSKFQADVADLFILLCSFLLTTASIVFVVLVLLTQGTPNNDWTPIPREPLSILQRAISSLSVTITSAVIVVAGKRYVLFKLVREGLRSRRVAVYSNPSIANLACYLVLHGAELPLLSLSAVWGWALVTSLTVNDSWAMGSSPFPTNIGVPFGPFNLATPGSSWAVSASEQLRFVISSVCLGVPGAVGLINVTSNTVATDYPTGIVYYPPLPYTRQDIGFSFSTTLNGFNISTEPLSSVPSSAQNLTCSPSALGTPLNLWFDGSDNQTLSIIATSPSDFSSVFRFNASAVMLGGTLSSNGSYIEFALNGTSWPNVMQADSQWAQDITSLICNATFSPIGSCQRDSSFSDFASLLNTNFESLDGDAPYTHWSTILNMALCAYSSAMYPQIGVLLQDIPSVSYGAQLTSQYGIYILMINIVVSLIMLVVVVRLRLGSPLGADFINSTRLLMDPLKKPELFNASLHTTVEARADPYMLVREDSEFVLTEQKSATERRKCIGMFGLWNPFNRNLR